VAERSDHLDARSSSTERKLSVAAAGGSGIRNSPGFRLARRISSEGRVRRIQASRRFITSRSW
jgi:hypothetical protein